MLRNMHLDQSDKSRYLWWQLIIIYGKGLRSKQLEKPILHRDGAETPLSSSPMTFRLLNGLTPACWCYLVAAVPIQRPVGLQEKEREPLFIYRKCRRRSWCICSLISLPTIWRKWFHSSNDRRRWKTRIPDHGRSIDRYIIENAPQVCCLATRLRGLLSLVSKNFLKGEYKCNAHFWILQLFFFNHKGCFSQSLGNPIYYTSRKLTE